MSWKGAKSTAVGSGRLQSRAKSSNPGGALKAPLKYMAVDALTRCMQLADAGEPDRAIDRGPTLPASLIRS